MTADTPPQQTAEATLTFLAPAPTFQPNREHLVCDDTDGRLISRHFSAPSQVPRRSPASHLVPMAPGVATHKPDASTPLSSLSFEGHFTLHGYSFTEQVDCNARTSEVGRLSTGKGGLPLWGQPAGWQDAKRPGPHSRTKRTPAEGRGSKTLLGTVALFPPREAFSPH